MRSTAARAGTRPGRQCRNGPELARLAAPDVIVGAALIRIAAVWLRQLPRPLGCWPARSPARPTLPSVLAPLQQAGLPLQQRMAMTLEIGSRLNDPMAMVRM